MDSWTALKWVADKRKNYKQDPSIKHLFYSELKTKNDDDDDRDMEETYDQNNEHWLNTSSSSSSSSALAASSSLLSEEEIASNEAYIGENENTVTEKFKQDLISVTQQTVLAIQRKTSIIKNYVCWLNKRAKSLEYKNVYLDICKP